MKRLFVLLLGTVLLGLVVMGCDWFATTSEETTSATSSVTTTTLTTTTTLSTTSTISTLITDETLDLVLQWQNDETWMVTDTAGMDLTEIEIPSTYQGYPVTAIGDYAFAEAVVGTLVIPDSVIRLGECALWYMPGLTFLTLGKGLTPENVGEGNLDDCPYVEMVDIRFEDETLALELLRNLISVDEPLLLWVNVNGDNLTLTSVEGVVFDKAMSRLLFYPPNHGLDYYSIPEGVTEIGASAFVGTPILQTIVLPDSLTSIADMAFQGLPHLSSIVLPDGLLSLGDNAFRDCPTLTEIIIPESVEFIGESAFYFCDDLTIKVIVPTQPSGWDSNWNSGGCEVIWGFSPS